MLSYFAMIRTFFKQASWWVAISFALNLVWEVLQLPLYTIWQSAAAPRLAYAVLHCTAGDALIALVSFLFTSIILRTAMWPSSKPWRGSVLVISFGLAYTAYSEWRNVYEIGAWAYSPAMPLVSGIGLSPLLQWLIVPAITLLVFRAAGGARSSMTP